MRYTNALQVLPEQVLEQIYQYVEGVVLYIPRRAEHKRPWGSGTPTRQVLAARNQAIWRDAQAGLSARALAERYYLSVKQIQRILAAQRRECAQGGTAMSIIHTDRLTLRPFVPEDAPAVLALSQEPGMRRWVPDEVYADLAEARDALDFLIARYPGRELPYVLAVCLGDRLIGHVGLSALLDGVEIGYAIGQADQGRGYAAEAVRALTAWGRSTLGLPFVYGSVEPDNAPSVRVLRRAGYRFDREQVIPYMGRDVLRHLYLG